MSKNIDFNKLSEDDVEYLLQRPWLLQEEQRRTGKSAKEILSSGLDVDESELESELESEPESESELESEPEQPSTRGPEASATPNPDDEDEEDEEGEPYSEWEYNDLLAEISDRNEERDEESKIKPASRKGEDLIAALEADDEANAE